MFKQFENIGNRYPYFILFLYTCFSHIFIFLNDLPFWDGWIYHEHVQTNNFDAFFQPWLKNGRPVIGYFYWLIAKIHPIYGFHLIEMLAVAVSASFVFILLSRFLKLHKTTSLLIPLIGIVFPSYQAHLALTTISYIMFLPFFFAGIYFSFLQQEARVLWEKVFYRVLSILLLFFSFFSEALIATGLIVPVLLFLKKGKTSFKSAKSFIFQHIDYLVIPFLSFIIVIKYMPCFGTYSNARNIGLNLKTLFNLGISYIGAAFDFNSLNLSIEKIPLTANISLVLVTCVIMGYLIIMHNGKRLLDNRNFIGICIGILSFLLTTAPFIVASRATDIQNFQLRHVTPLGFFIALIVVCSFKLVFKKENSAHTITLLLLCIMTVSFIKESLVWQSKGAIIHSCMQHMKQSKPLKEASTILVTYNNQRIGWRAPVFYEWIMILHTIYGRFYQFVAPAKVHHIEVQKSMACYCPGNTYDEKGACVELNITIHATMKIIIGIQYLVRKFFLSEENLKTWLNKLVAINVKPCKEKPIYVPLTSLA